VKILIIGNFGFKTNNIGGQTIKTRNLLSLYQQKVGKESIDYIDLDKISILLIFSLFIKILKSNEIILVPGKKFLNLFFIPIILITKGKKISLFAVGGWLGNFLKDRPIIRKYIAHVNFIYVESESLVTFLGNYNINNVKVFPNFRFHNFVENQKIDIGTYDIIFMARITESKGCNLLFNFIAEFNRILPKNNLTLSFYGPIDFKYKQSFLEQISLYPNTSYNGVCPPQDVFDVISRYDVCVLPTFYEGEGFPGTIVDSYIAGVPVVVSDWLNLPEFVDNGKTGLIFSLNEKDSLFKSLMNLYNNPDLLSEMKRNAKIKSQEYSSETAWEIIANR